MTAPVAISGIDDPDQIRIRLLASGRDVHAPLAALDDFYQPKDADLTSWAAITRAAGFDAFVATPSSANLRTLITDETGTGATVFANAPTITGIPVFSGIPSLTGGALTFPASQVASAGANDLDDYEEGTWTPTLTFATPGNVSVAYTLRNGEYTKIGNLVIAWFLVTTTTFTHTTASGNLSINGLPFTVGTNHRGMGALQWAGFTLAAGQTSVVARAEAGGTSVGFIGSGSGAATSFLTATEHATGTNVTLIGFVAYHV